MNYQTAPGNLPPWNEAASVYRRLYKGLETMARKGHATPGHFGKGLRGSPGTVSPDMRKIIEDLGEGDEERLKYDLNWMEVYGYAD